MLVVARRFLRRSGSEESIQWEDRPSGASAPSLSANPMPFRITQESYRPRVSNRTMVGTLPARSACKFQEPNGVDNEACHETIGMGTTRPALRREKAVQTKWQLARGAGCARNSTASGRGGKMSLDIPSYRTSHNRHNERQIAHYYHRYSPRPSSHGGKAKRRYRDEYQARHSDTSCLRFS